MLVFVFVLVCGRHGEMQGRTLTARSWLVVDLNRTSASQMVLAMPLRGELVAFRISDRDEKNLLGLRSLCGRGPPEGPVEAAGIGLHL